MKLPGRKLLYENEISWFVLASAMDVFVTFIILRLSGQGLTRLNMIESNPVAQWVIRHSGMPGMVAFKFVMVAIVVTAAELVGRKHFRIGRLLLLAGTTVVGGVAVYSLILLSGQL